MTFVDRLDFHDDLILILRCCYSEKIVFMGRRRNRLNSAGFYVKMYDKR